MKVRRRGCGSALLAHRNAANFQDLSTGGPEVLSASLQLVLAGTALALDPWEIVSRRLRIVAPR